MVVCEDAPDKYCGHIVEPADRMTDDAWDSIIRNAVCLREPRYEGLCVWHADTDEKTMEELMEARLTPDDVPWEMGYAKEHLSGAILRGIQFPIGFSFSGCTLVHAEFRDVDLQEAKFIDANLLESKFLNTNLREAVFPISTLSGTEFSDTNLRKAEFPKATLYGAKFPDANLRLAWFHDANLIAAKFTNANLQMSWFPKAILDGAEFRYANLEDAWFPNANLQAAKFPNANLEGAWFRDANLQAAKFPNANLTWTDLRDADLTEAEFPDANLTKAEFPGANLQDAKFPNTNLQDAEFPSTNLQNAEFSEADLQRVNLSAANIQGAVFSQADLREVLFRPACVSGIEFEADSLGASLEDAQFEDGTDLRGADFSGVRLYQTAFRDVRINDQTRFGWDDGTRYGKKCRYEYDPNTGVSINEDVPRLRAAAWTYRRLESLFEENAMGARARNAHIRKEEAQRAYHQDRIEGDWIGESGFRPQGLPKSVGEYMVSTLNWHLHRHGESLRRLLGVSGLLIFLCGIVYAVAGIARDHPETTYRITVADLGHPGAVLADLVNGWYFSVITFSTIGYGDFYPASPLSRLLVGVESLAGALFIALFVFVIGRRVAR